MSLDVQEFLSRLDSKRAFNLFVITLLISISLTFAEVAEPVGPSIPVFLYTAILFYCQAHYFLTFSSIVKDSPYFLGFILTLVGLIQILTGGFAAGTSAVLISRVASAILPTVVGLFCRQLVLSWDPGDTYFDREYQTIAEGLRADAAKFRDSQARFVTLVTEFVRTREELLSGEEKVFAEYVSSLKDGAGVLSRIQKDYPKRIEGLLKKFDDLAEGVAQAGSRIQSTVSDLSSTYSREFESGSLVLATARSELESQTIALHSAFKKGLDGFAEHAAGLGKVTSSHAESAEQLRAATSQLSLKVKDTGEEISKCHTESAEQLRVTIGQFSLRVKDAGEEISNVLNDLKGFAGEIRAIDGIVTDLIQLLDSRIQELRVTG